MTLENEGTIGAYTLGSVGVVDRGTIGSGVGRHNCRWDCEMERSKNKEVDPGAYIGMKRTDYGHNCVTWTYIQNPSIQSGLIARWPQIWT